MYIGATHESAGVAHIDSHIDDLLPRPHGTQRSPAVNPSIPASRDHFTRHGPSVPEPHAGQITGNDELADALGRNTEQRRCVTEIDEFRSHGNNLLEFSYVYKNSGERLKGRS
jgi:hypothetical protein